MTEPVLIFDLDDTLLDDSAAKAYYLPKLYKRHQALINHDFNTFKTRWFNAIDKYWKLYVEGKVSFQRQRFMRIMDSFENEILNDKELMQITRDFDTFFEESWKLFDGVMDFLTEYQSFKMGLITNGMSDHQRKKIEKLRIEPFFDSIVISEEVGFQKPDVEIFQLSCNELGCTPDECYFIGDRIDPDVIGAINSGMKPVWVNNYGAELDEAFEDVIEIKSVVELRNIVRKPF